MQLFYAPEITPPVYTLTEEESKHAVRVLRLVVGDRLNITDGRGNMYTAEVADASPKACVVRVVEAVAEYQRLPYRLTMAVAPTKNADRYEWFLEKATEVGVDRFVPIACDHSERRTLKLDRAVRVVTSAMKQSLKAYHPVVDELTPLKEIIKNSDFDGVKLIAHCEDKGESPKFISDYVEKGGEVLILIGPEGDFSIEEINFALANGFKPVSLGESRLRTETAALAAVMNVAFINQ